MGKIPKRTVLILMMILSMLGLFGCGGSRDEKAEKRILEALQEKYGEEFVLDSIGGAWGSMNSNTLKAIVRPKSDETMQVRVEITKDLKKVYDKYLNKTVAKAAQQPIQEFAQRYWSDSKVVIDNDTRLVYPEHTDTKMSYSEFLKLYPMNIQVISIYINSEGYIDSKGNMNQEVEIQKYMSFAKNLTSNSYVSSLIGISYLSPEAYKRFDEVKSSENNIDLFYNEDTKKTGIQNIVTMVGYKLGSDGQIVETEGEIQKFFDEWKNDRVKSMQQSEGL